MRMAQQAHLPHDPEARRGSKKGSSFGHKSIAWRPPCQTKLSAASTSPSKAKPEELVLPVEDREVLRRGRSSEAHLRIYVLPGPASCSSRRPRTPCTGPPNVRVAGFTARGAIIIGRLDSMHGARSVSPKHASRVLQARGAQRCLGDLATPIRPRRRPRDHDRRRHGDVTARWDCQPSGKCSADPTRNDALVLWDYADEGWNARLSSCLPRKTQRGLSHSLGCSCRRRRPPPRNGEEMITEHSRSRAGLMRRRPRRGGDQERRYL